MISLVWRLLGGLVMVLALFLGGYGLGNKQAKTSCIAGQVEAQRAAITQTAKEDARREAIGAARETSREQIRVVYKTIKEQAHETIISHPEFNNCKLDDDGLRLWNAANAGSAAPLSGEPYLSLHRSTTREIGQPDRPADQSHRGDGAVSGLPGQAGKAGGVR